MDLDLEACRPALDNSVKATNKKHDISVGGVNSWNLGLEGSGPALDKCVKGTMKRAREFCRRCELIKSGPVNLQASF